MITLSSSMQAFENPLVWGTELPKHIDDHTGFFGCWVEFKHLFHSDCFLCFFLTIAVTTPNVERSFSSMKRIKTFLWATMTDTKLSSLALIHIHRDFRVYINSVTDSFNEKKNRQIQTELNNNTLTLNNFDMPRTLFRISKCNRLGTPPGVLSWAHGRVLCVFSMHKEESVFSYEQGSYTEHFMRQAFGCLKRSPGLL